MNDIDYILSQLTRYYDCLLTDTEEARLRLLVARSRSKHPEIERLRAMMGFMRPKRRRYRHMYYVTTAAASIGLLIAAGISWTIGTTDGHHGTSFAYSGGVYISDENLVLDLLAQNLSEFGGDIEESDRSMESELQEFAAILPDNINLQ